MARVTIEDCLDKGQNRFELVHKAARRARELQTGLVRARVPEGTDKVTVIALREIAANLLQDDAEKDIAPDVFDDV